MQENISSKFIKSIKSMYDIVKSYVRYKGDKSSCINSNIGVKQGDSSSSLLCLFFLNDIINNINSNINGLLKVHDIEIFLLLFADDAVVFAYDPFSLQSMLNDIENYSNTWGLRLNVNKTKIMIFENGRHTYYDFFLYNTRIEVVTTFKYLGVHLFKNGNWNRTQKKVAQYALFSMHNLFIVNNQLELPVSQQLSLFDTLVSPILNYSAEVWGYHKSPDVEAVHNKYCRKLLFVRSSTNLEAIYGELGRLPMYVYRKLKMIKFWLKLLQQKETSLLFKTYYMLKTDVENGLTYDQNNWAYHIKIILDQAGLSYLWQNQFNMLLNYNTIKQRIIDIYQQTWYSAINNSLRLKTYCLFKHNFSFEPYLDKIREKKYRIALTKFRTSSHDLFIETGRHINVPRIDRKCVQCRSGMIENEFHHLLICTKYKDLRERYLKKYYFTWPTIQKFVNLLSIKSGIVLINMSKFLYHANKNID